jgi:hypothetical protein
MRTWISRAPPRSRMWCKSDFKVRAADDGVLDQQDALALEHLAQRRVFHAQVGLWERVTSSLTNPLRKSI